MKTYPFRKYNTDIYATIFYDEDELDVKKYLSYMNLWLEFAPDYQTNTKRRNPHEELDARSAEEICEKVLERWNAVKEGPEDKLFQPVGVLISRDRVIIVHSTPGYPIYHPPSP